MEYQTKYLDLWARYLLNPVWFRRRDYPGESAELMSGHRFKKRNS
jgi:hypothetical protein